MTEIAQDVTIPAPAFAAPTSLVSKTGFRVVSRQGLKRRSQIRCVRSEGLAGK